MLDFSVLVVVHALIAIVATWGGAATGIDLIRISKSGQLRQANTLGPDLPFTLLLGAAVQLHQTCYSSIAR